MRENLQSKLRLNKYIPVLPTPRQALFLMCMDREVFYGGAAGGGKSTSLLMAGLQFVEVPNYAALLLRRTFSDLALPGALMEKAKDWLVTTDARWHDNMKTWEFPSGATLTFGYLENENDKYRYQSSEFQYIGFDELSQFSETQYTYLFSRLRRLKGSKVPVRMRGASNPGGTGHKWVRQRFLIEGPSRGRKIIRAKMKDNPHLDIDEYRLATRELDPVTRLQIEEGNWEISETGNKFQREWFKIISTLPAGLQPVRYWDFAATEKSAKNTDPDWTAGALVADWQGRLIILNIVRIRATPGDVEALVKQTAMLDGRGVPIYIEVEGGAAGPIMVDHYRRNVLRGYTVYDVRPSGSKEVRAMPLSAAAKAGNVLLLEGNWINDFIDEAVLFPRQGYGIHDDQIDAVSGGSTVVWLMGDEEFTPAVGGEHAYMGQIQAGSFGPGTGGPGGMGMYTPGQFLQPGQVVIPADPFSYRSLAAGYGPGPERGINGAGSNPYNHGGAGRGRLDDD